MARHVLLIVENLTVPRDRRVWNEATTLRRAGYDVTVICPIGPGYAALDEVLEGVRILRHPVPEDTGSRIGFVKEYLNALWWERRLTRRVWREQPFDVMHLSNPPDVLFLVARKYRRRHNVRVVFDHHDLSPELYETKFGRKGLMYRLLLWFERQTFRSVDRVISTNESIREVAIRRGGKEPSDVRVVRNGPDPEVFAPRAADPRVRRGRGSLVVWLGHMGAQAGLNDLVRAAAHLVHDHDRDDIHFMVIGDGPARPSTEERAEALGVRNHIEFTGPLYGDELIRHVASCDIGLLTLPRTPLGDRSTPTKTMEYMSLGLPVVQYELVESRRTAGDAALHARPNDPADLGDKILHLADRPAERARLGAIGRERVVEELAWRHQASRLIDLYSDLTTPA